MSVMIENPLTYFNQWISHRSDLLREMESEAAAQSIPIVGPVVGRLLYMLARMSRPDRILELGTATGYSAIYLARACEALEGRVVTLERKADMARRAQANFEKAGLGQRVEIVVGDAFEEMTRMREPFDLAFLDIDKEGYAGALSHCDRLLKPGGLLVADNVAFQGADEFNRVVSARSHWRAVHLLSFLPQHSPEKDGLCLAVRV